MPPLTPEQQELFDTLKKTMLELTPITSDSWVNYYCALAACLDAGFNPVSYLP